MQPINVWLKFHFLRVTSVEIFRTNNWTINYPLKRTLVPDECNSLFHFVNWVMVYVNQWNPQWSITVSQSVCTEVTRTLSRKQSGI